jgi:LysM repeat protein
MRQHPIVVALAFFAIAASSASAQIDSTTIAPVVKHTVKRGDTLWDIAKYYLKDPFLWPKVFHANTGVIKNPHWIYPGQVLSILGSAVRDDIAARVDRSGHVVSRVQTRSAGNATVFLVPRSAPLPSQYANIERPKVNTVLQGEYEAAPFVASDKQPIGGGDIVGTVERLARGLVSDAGFKIYDRLYVTAPVGAILHRGDRLLLAKRGDVILDVGVVIEPTGIIRIDSVPASGPAIGTIVKQFHEITSTQITLPYEQVFRSTTVRAVKGVYDVKGTVLWIRKRPPLPSIQTYVILGVPKSTVVQPGDQFTLYDQDQPNSGSQVQPVATATVQIVRITPLGVTGIIINQRQPKVEEGMSTTLTAKMP